MYLSRIALNDKLRATMKALASPQILHGAVESCFKWDGGGEKRERALWRIDYLNGVCYLLILSAEKPELGHIAGQFGYDYNDIPWRIGEYGGMLEKIENGGKWRFRLTANPAKSCTNDSDTESGRGGIHAHVTLAQQKEWLINRAERNGFSVGCDSFDVTHTEWKIFRKTGQGDKVTLRVASYEGVLTVTDAESLKKALIGGIGRGKAYGCGMLTLARI